MKGKDANDMSITHSADNSPRPAASPSPKKRFSLTKVISGPASPRIDRKAEEREDSPRLSMMFRNMSGSKLKQTSVTLSETTLKQLKCTYPQLCKNIHEESSGKLMELETDLDRIHYLLSHFSSLSDDLIAKRSMLLDNEKNALDIFVYQNLPPHLVYLYCESLVKGGLTEGWLISLMNLSEVKITNTLIYIATREELTRESMGAELLFRESSFVNKLSVCYSKIANATEYLNRLIAKIILLIRSSEVYYITQKSDVLSIACKEDFEKFKENFRVLIAKVAHIIANIEYQETIATILSLRYQLVSEYFDAAIAATSAQSLFGLRLFVPPFDCIPIAKTKSSL